MSGTDVLDGHLRPFNDYPPAWLNSVGGVLLLELRSGATSRARSDAARTLLALLRDSIWASAPAPFVSPSGLRGFSAEFVGRGVEVHVEVSEGEGSTVYVLDPGIEEWEGPLEQVPDGIEKWAWRLGHD